MTYQYTKSDKRWLTAGVLVVLALAVVGLWQVWMWTGGRQLGSGETPVLDTHAMCTPDSFVMCAEPQVRDAIAAGEADALLYVDACDEARAACVSCMARAEREKALLCGVEQSCEL